MNINIQPTASLTPDFFPVPVCKTIDFPQNGDMQPGFSSTTITVGSDTITIMLPFGGRITYHNEHQENA